MRFVEACIFSISREYNLDRRGTFGNLTLWVGNLGTLKRLKLLLSGTLAVIFYHVVNNNNNNRRIFHAPFANRNV